MRYDIMQPAKSRHSRNSQPLRKVVCAVAVLVLLTVGCAKKPTGPNVIDADAPTEFTETSSGLKYRILRKSNGRRPKSGDTVLVDYAGKLDDGTTFDSSYNRWRPETFGLGEVVQGFTEAVMLIGEGGMIEVEIPPDLGYGDEGKDQIPPGATLHFKIELHEVTPP